MYCLFGIRHNLKRIFFIKTYIRLLSHCNFETMKYLNVAEKNDAAKNIAQHLSRGTSRRVSSFHPCCLICFQGD